MRFSILVPVYQVEEYLPECIQSIKKQTFQDYEVILVDDGTKDNSGKICDQYANEDSRVHVIHKENEGLLLARRTAIKAAKGEYFVFVDSDDFLEPTALADIDLAIKKSNADIILYNAQILKNGKKLSFYNSIFDQKKYCGEKKKIIIERMTNDFSIYGMWLKAVNRNIVNIDEDYTDRAYVSNGEDLLQTLALFDQAESIYYLDKCLYNYRITSSSMTYLYNPLYFKAFKCAFATFINMLEKWDMDNYKSNVYGLFLNRVFEDIIRTTGINSTLTYYEKKRHLIEIKNDSFFQEAYCNGRKNLKRKRDYFGLFLLVTQQYYLVIVLICLLEKLHFLTKDK